MPRDQDPVRLRVNYQSPRSLLAEFTRSVGRQAVALLSHRPAPSGARFLFELTAEGVRDKVEVMGEVTRCTPAAGAPGRYELVVRYDAGADRRGLDEALQWIAQSHDKDKRRRAHPRIPFYIQAGDGTPGSPRYLVRNLSRGGAGVEVDAGQAPRALQAGAPFLLELEPAGRPALLLHGEVAWRTRPLPGRARSVNPTFGVKFGTLRPDAASLLEKILTLRGLPPPPWQAHVSFGMEAVSRMP